VKGPPAGFSRGVNDGLIAASTLVHFKAAGLLGFALTLAGIVVSHHPVGQLAANLHLAGLLLLIAAACCAGAVIYPKKNTRKGGLIFWGDIVTHASPGKYSESLERLVNPEDADREYAFTNYRLSQVLDTKYSIIRWAVCLLLLGSALAGASRALE
jgi:hypothetical protein